MARIFWSADTPISVLLEMRLIGSKPLIAQLQSMNRTSDLFTTFAALFALALLGCEQSEVTADSHHAAVLRFQDGQTRFRELLSTIRDENSFADARVELAEISAEWREVAAILRRLDPLSEEERRMFRKMIEEHNMRAVPTSGDMLNLVSLGSREAKIMDWQEEFVTAGSAVGNEFARLYGPIGESGSENAVPRIDLSSVTVNDAPLDRALGESATYLHNKNQGEQDIDAQPGGTLRVGD